MVIDLNEMYRMMMTMMITIMMMMMTMTAGLETMMAIITTWVGVGVTGSS